MLTDLDRSIVMKLITLIAILLLNPYLHLSHAQHILGYPPVENYSNSQTLGGNRTWAIKQDSKGIMYFANSDGLLTFDGVRWRKYILPNHTVIRSLYIDQNDRIYVGGQGEFGYFEYHTGEDMVYTSFTKQVPARYQRFADIWNVVSYEGALFFRGINAIFQLRNEKLTVHEASTGWQFLGVAGGRLLAQDEKKGLLEFRHEKWNPIEASELLAGEVVSAFFQLDANKLIVSTLANKVYLLKGKELELLQKAGRRELYTPSFASVSKEAYVVATATEGCIIRTLDGTEVQRIGKTEGLQNNNVTAVFVDRDRNIWASVDNGIALISYGSSIRYFRPNPVNDVAGYSARIYKSKIFLSSSNGVYTAPIQTALKDQSLSKGSFSLLPGSDRGEAWRLDDIDGTLFLSHNRGVYTVDDHHIKPLSSGLGSWLFLPISGVNQDKYTVIGTYRGLQLLSYGDDGVPKVERLSGPSDSYRFLEADKDGTIWASHPYRGIYRIHISPSTLSYTAELFGSEQGLPSAYQNYVAKVGGKVVFTTPSGIYEFDAKKTRFYASNLVPQLKELPMHYLKEDPSGNLWFFSDKKLGVLPSSSHKNGRGYFYFPELEGLSTSGFESIYPFDSHNVYVGFEKGLIHINLSQYLLKSKPAVLISSVMAMGRQDSVLFSGDPQGEQAVLDGSFNSFSIKYAATAFGAGKYLTYACRLEGYDSNWSSWTVATEKNYTNLPPGKYVFQVKAKDNLNQESTVTEYIFAIRPPWYKSVWAIIGYVSLLCITIYRLYRWQQIIWQRRQIEFEQEMARVRYIHQLEIEKNEKEIVKLQNEKLESEVISKTRELAKTSMHLMENSGALSKLRMELTKLNLPVEEGSDLKKVTGLLKDVESNTTHWDQFASHFDELNDGFILRLKQLHPALSRNDLKVCAYLRLNYSTKQIAQLQGISVRGVEVHRYRLRKKLDVIGEESLSSYLGKV